MKDPSRFPRWPRRGLGLLALLALLGASLSPTAAQKGFEPVKPPPGTMTLKEPATILVGDSGCSFLALMPGDLLDHPLMKHLPARMREHLQEVEREMPHHLGVSPRRLQRLLIAFPAGGMQHPVGLMVSNKKFTPESVLKALGPTWEWDKDVIRSQRPDVIRIHSDSLLLIGRERDINVLLDRVQTGRPDPTLYRGLVAAENGAQFVIGLRPDDMIGLFGRGQATTKNVAPATKDAPYGKKEFRKDDFPKAPEEKSPPPPGLSPAPPEAGGLPGAAGQPAVGVGPPPRVIERPDPAVAPAPDLNEQPMRPTMRELVKEMPPEALPYKPLLLNQAATLAVRLTDDTATVSLNLAYSGPEQVEDAQASLRIALYVLREVLPRWWMDEVGLEKETAVQVVRALDRVGEALRKTTISVNGQTVSATTTLPLEPELVGVLLREMPMPGGFSTERMNHFKQIGLALHNYHDTMGALPGTAYYSAQGKPLLSWRVAILPYIEQQDLYRQFKLDEPWDSPHNIKLLEKMPKIFAAPAGVQVKPGYTFVQGFSGPGTIFDPTQDRKQPGVSMGCRISAVSDGLSNTAMVGESGTAVPWTKPEDIPCDVRGVPPLGCIPGSGRCLVLMGDGAVFTITSNPPRDQFSHMTGRQDGAVFNIEDLKPGRRPRH